MSTIVKNVVRSWEVFAILGMACFPLVSQAHVTVRPKEAGIASYQTFTVSVPSEKDAATVGVRLLIPSGVESVTPTVKTGWSVNVLRSGGVDTPPTELVWEGGNIPPHFRDEFTFSAKMPAAAGTLAWKAYQEYSNGEVVAWENPPIAEQPKKPDGSPDFSFAGPYSETAIVDDLAEAPRPADKATWAFAISLIALALSAGALGKVFRK